MQFLPQFASVRRRLREGSAQGVGQALAAAALFGASTPFARRMAGEVHPVLLAGILYLGSGLGLALWALVRRGHRHEAPLQRADVPWLAASTVVGGIVAPVLLMVAMRTTLATTASLLLNLEGVLTAAIAWVVFRENVSRTVFAGMAAIVVGGVLVARQGGAGGNMGVGALLVVGACACWATDNNLTQKLSARDPVSVAAVKGAVAGTVNLTLAGVLGAHWPGAMAVGASLVVGALGYGASLALYVSALRSLGSARTAAYFAAAPFVGAVLGAVLLHEGVGVYTAAGGGLMLLGVMLHLRERHDHPHEHRGLAHEHQHSHDEHHQHAHPEGMAATEPHSHHHEHAPLRHTHPHTPDLHHRHGHGG